MKVSTKKNLVLELDETELRFLKDLTQNYNGEPGDETEKENKLRLSFFAAASKALGYDVSSDGSINRASGVTMRLL